MKHLRILYPFEKKRLILLYQNLACFTNANNDLYKIHIKDNAFIDNIPDVNNLIEEKFDNKTKTIIFTLQKIDKKQNYVLEEGTTQSLYIMTKFCDITYNNATIKTEDKYINDVRYEFAIDILLNIMEIYLQYRSQSPIELSNLKHLYKKFVTGQIFDFFKEKCNTLLPYKEDFTIDITRDGDYVTINGENKNTPEYKSMIKFIINYNTSTVTVDSHIFPFRGTGDNAERISTHLFNIFIMYINFMMRLICYTKPLCVVLKTTNAFIEEYQLYDELKYEYNCIIRSERNIWVSYEKHEEDMLYLLYYKI